jgi:hypothetical protein
LRKPREDGCRLTQKQDIASGTIGSQEAQAIPLVEEFLRMKCEAILSLSIAVTSLALLSPKPVQAQSATYPSTSMDDTNQSTAQQVADEMVPVQIVLERGLDAKKIQPGQQFKARLDDTAHLKNGPELPRGTVLVGQVTTDDLQMQGNSKLALRFTDAHLKDGKDVPIKATIVAVTPSGELSPNGAPVDAGSGVWDHKMLQIDQISAFSGVDLHSRISSPNSGVFVTTTKDDVKLGTDSHMTVAIAARQGGYATPAGE